MKTPQQIFDKVTKQLLAQNMRASGFALMDQYGVRSAIGQLMAPSDFARQPYLAESMPDSPAVVAVLKRRGVDFQANANLLFALEQVQRICHIAIWKQEFNRVAYKFGLSEVA